MTGKKSITLPLEEIYPVMREVLDSGGEFAITVTGSSMSPFLHHLKDQAIFAPLGDRRLRRGDIVFYRRASGQFVMHRVYAVLPDGSLTMVGDAQRTLEPGIRREQVLAYVTAVVRNGKRISCQRGAWRRLMTFYLHRIDRPRLIRAMILCARLPYRVIRRVAGRCCENPDSDVE